jgi:TonB family protein
MGRAHSVGTFALHPFLHHGPARGDPLRWMGGLLGAVALMVSVALTWEAARDATVRPTVAATAQVESEPLPAILPPLPRQPPDVPAMAPAPPRPVVAPRSQRFLRGEVAATGALRGIRLRAPEGPAAVVTPPRAPERSRGFDADYTPDGLLQPSLVVRGIREERGAIIAVYQRLLRQRPDLSGDLLARLTLDSEGRVTDVAITRDSVGSRALRREVLATLRRWRAPLPAAAAAIYELPFHFEKEPSVARQAR